MHTELSAKRIELLREILPGLSRVVVLSNANNPGHTPQVAEMEAASSQLGLEFVSLPIRESSELAETFAAAARTGAEAIIVLDDTAFTNNRAQILELAAQHALPVVSRYKDFADAGALIAYGPSLPAIYRRAADYTDKILKGVKPSDLPIEEPRRFDLVVNLKTARSLGLTVPTSVLVRADQVLE
jgi:putative ABC transport system substrate-binding protein